MATTLQLQIFSIEERESNPQVPCCDCLNIKFQYFSYQTVHPSNPRRPLTVFREHQFSFPCDLFRDNGDNLLDGAFSAVDIPSELWNIVSSRVVYFAKNMVAADNGKGSSPVLNMAVRIHVRNHTPRDGDDSCRRQVSRKSFINSLLKVRVVGDDDACCSICLDKFGDLTSEVVGTPCSHAFHQDCILRWLKNHWSCPLCRYQVF
ncbi:hypothetical protein L6164_029085 [Bauhinia variegata]|uniref:Uncharacterized protein n=1 Tax=Bauhinia variegata TaxID=167791 RepID=A0ACB9L8H5_BAUVA|nr:hypothetical protein L6164_029085 [Bauhinia variegata]